MTGFGVALCGVAGLLASPVSWSHHFVWIVPLAVVLVRDLLPVRRPAPAAVVVQRLGLPSSAGSWSRRSRNCRSGRPRADLERRGEPARSGTLSSASPSSSPPSSWRCVRARAPPSPPHPPVGLARRDLAAPAPHERFDRDRCPPPPARPGPPPPPLVDRRPRPRRRCLPARAAHRVATQNVNFVPSLLLLGSAVVPGHGAGLRRDRRPPDRRAVGAARPGGGPRRRHRHGRRRHAGVRRPAPAGRAADDLRRADRGGGQAGRAARRAAGHAATATRAPG